MAFCTFKNGLSMLLLVVAIIQVADAGDSEITADFEPPSNVTMVDVNYFTHTAMRALMGADPPKIFKVLKASAAEFPALTGQSVSYAVLQYPGRSINRPHTHPQTAELLFLLTGSLEVGFIDTAHKLHSQTLQAGDMFVFPKGFVHYQYNNDVQDSAFALSAFGSANVETLSVPFSLFASGITDEVLANAFKTNISTMQKIRADRTAKS